MWASMLPWCLGAVHEFTGTWAARENAGSGHEKAADVGLGLLLWGRTTACEPHALGGDQCGERRGPDLEHCTTHNISARAVGEVGMPATREPIPWSYGTSKST